jgi:putative ABC transport system permease protein
VTSAQLGVEQIQNTGSSFNIFIYFIMVMAILIAIIGTMGLMGTMSINVMETRRSRMRQSEHRVGIFQVS